MSRAEQAVVVRREVLDAALREFLHGGFHGTTLDRIAAAAGYTKGAVYSRYESKADLFLALLEERIEARRAENERLVAGLRATGAGGVAALARRWSEAQRRDQPWTLLVLEFRVHAARDAALLERYAALHERTLDGIAEVLEPVVGSTPARRRRLAQTIFAMGNGASFEQAVDPRAFSPAEVGRWVEAIVGEELGR